DGNPTGTPKQITLDSYYNNQRTNPYYYFDYDWTTNYYFYAYNFTYPPPGQTVVVTQNKIQYGFGSRHPGAMNMLLCDGTGRRFAYGTPGLMAIVGLNDGQILDLD